MPESESSTIDNLDTLAEALRYATSLVGQTQGTLDTSFSFMSSYEYYGTVDVNLPISSTISVPTVEILNPSADKYFTFNKDVLSESFYLKDDPSASGNNTIDEIDDIPIGYQMLTDDMIRKYSINAGGTINMKTAYYSAGVTFDPDNDDDDTVLSSAMAGSLFYKNSDVIPVSDIDWDVFIRTADGSISSPFGKGYITLTNINIMNSITADSITSSSDAYSFDDLLIPYVASDMIIGYNAEIPESKMHIDFNMLTGRKVRESQFYKAGAIVSIRIENRYTDAEIIQMVEDHFSATGYAAAFSGIDAMLTHAQTEMMVDYIIKKVLSIDDTGLQI